MKNYYKKIIAGAIMIFGLTIIQAQVTGNTCDLAIPISEGIYTVDNLENGDGASNLCFDTGGINAVWFEYTPSFSGVVTINSGIGVVTPDTRLSVYNGDCNALTCIGSDDDGGDAFSSFLQFEVTEGDAVYVEWDDRWEDEGFSFFIGEEEVVFSGCTDPTALNYNQLANLDDGTCIYEIECEENFVSVLFADGSFFTEISWSITDQEGETYAFGQYNQNIQQLCLPDGCYSFNMFDGFGDGWNGAVATIFLDDDGIAEGTLQEGSVGNFTFGVNTDPCDDIVLEILGCTDPTALNYNPSANIDDGNCAYPFDCEVGIPAQIYVCTFSNGEQVGVNVSGDNASVVFDQDGFANIDVMYQDICLEEGVCYTVTMTNNEGPLGWDQSYYWISVDGITISTGSLEGGLAADELIFSIDGTCGEVLGCTDPEADNFNEEATIDNGSCQYTIANDNCGDAIALSVGVVSINNLGATSEGLYGSCWGFGNGEPEQNGIWYSFTTPEEPALIVIEAISDGSYTLTDTQFGLYDECGGEMIYCDGNSGEGLLSKFELACGMLEPGTEYLLLIDGWAGNQGTCLLSYEVADGCESIEGCTDPTALNYNPDATIDNGTCAYAFECDDNEVFITFELGSWSNEVSWYITSLFGDAVIYAEGGVNDGQVQMACLPDGCYQLIMEDSFGDGWNGNIMTMTYNQEVILQTTLETGQSGVVTFGINSLDCGLFLEGCTDPNAINYNPEAVIDDGSCEYGGLCDSNEGGLFIFSNQAAGGIGAWTITDDNGDLFYGGEFGENQQATYDLCLPDGCYDLCVWAELEDVSGFAEFWIANEGYLFDFEGQSCYSFSVNDNCDGTGGIAGCTDPFASNYNPLATEDDGSCEYEPFPGDCQASFEIFSIDETEDVVWILNTSTIGWGIEYLWDFGDGNISYAPLPIHTYVEDGTYEICLTISGPNECEDTYCMLITYEGPGAPNDGGNSEGSNSGFSINVIEDLVSGIDEDLNAVSNLSLYPNPTAEIINIQYELNQNTDVQMNVYDITGAKVMAVTAGNSIGQNNKVINVSALNSGLYMLEMIVEGQRSVNRFNIIK